jgi:molybdate transport repressor ModE-like protein
MDIELYRTFLAISDTGSFTAAARQVGRTQSAVSQQVRRLEETLGQPLFARAGGSVDLTEYGKSLLESARTIVETHNEVVTTYKRTAFEGIIVVGVADAYVNRILKQVAAEFARLYPKATLKIVIDDSLGLSRRIADGSVDLAFVTEGNCPTRGPVAFYDRLVLVGPVAGDIHLQDPLPVVVWDERNQDEVPLTAALDAMGRGCRATYVCRSVHAQHQVIKAGLAVGVLVEGSMEEGERAYLEADGFPVFKRLTIRLERSRAKKSQAIDRLEKHLLAYFTAAQGEKAKADLPAAEQIAVASVDVQLT